MAIGIGLHCWYCDHGPCNGECDYYKKNEEDKIKNEEDKIKNIFKWLSKKDYLSDNWEKIYNEYIKEKQ